MIRVLLVCVEAIAYVAIILALLTAIALWTKPRPWVYDQKLVCDYGACVERRPQCEVGEPVLVAGPCPAHQCDYSTCVRGN